MPEQQRMNHDISIGELDRQKGIERPIYSVGARMTFLLHARKDTNTAVAPRDRRAALDVLSPKGGKIAAARVTQV
jgi:hypothetical protein